MLRMLRRMLPYEGRLVRPILPGLLLRQYVSYHFAVWAEKSVKQPVPFMHSKLRKAPVQKSIYGTNISKLAGVIFYGRECYR